MRLCLLLPLFRSLREFTIEFFSINNNDKSKIKLKIKSLFMPKKKEANVSKQNELSTWWVLEDFSTQTDSFDKFVGPKVSFQDIEPR